MVIKLVDRVYEGSLMIGLKKDIPEEVINKLTGLVNKTISDKKMSIDECVDLGYDFNLDYMMSSSTPYESIVTTPIGLYDTTPEKFKDETITGYCLSVDISSESYCDDLIYELIDYLRPYIHELTPNYLGKVTSSDGFFKKEFYIYESLMKNDLLQFIDNLIHEEETDDYDDRDYKLGFTVALGFIRDYILRKKE